MFYDVCCWGSRDGLCTAALLFATVAAQWQAFPCNAVSSHNLLLCVVLHKTRACLCVSACNTRVFVRYLHAGSSFSPRGSTPEVTWFPPSKARSIPGGEEPHSLFVVAPECSFCSAHSVHTRHPSPLSAPAEKSIAAL